ncbi:MAG: thioredoxin [Zetaproteobacteria bacterium]|nr:MAG: thioredoxin [Zetaproteobacteria bacterium]
MALEIVTTVDFEREVITASHRLPVLVDFWAPWCGPCRMLAPTLEALADEFAERLRLVKINVDEAPELAARYQVRGVPSVKLFRHGEVVDEFTGAMPRPQIESWLKCWLPGPADDALDQLMQQVESGGLEQQNAFDQAEHVLDQHPEAHQARLRLADWLIEAGEHARAREHLMRLPGSMRDRVEVRQRMRRLEMLAKAGDTNALRAAVRTRPDDLELRLKLADALAAEGCYQESLQAYLEVLQRDRHFGDDAARKGMLAVFEMLGNRGELVDRYRREMAAVLFS